MPFAAARWAAAKAKEGRPESPRVEGGGHNHVPTPHLLAVQARSRRRDAAIMQDLPEIRLSTCPESTGLGRCIEYGVDPSPCRHASTPPTWSRMPTPRWSSVSRSICAARSCLCFCGPTPGGWRAAAETASSPLRGGIRDARREISLYRGVLPAASSAVPRCRSWLASTPRPPRRRYEPNVFSASRRCSTPLIPWTGKSCP